jgi:galactonate dehydratase
MALAEQPDCIATVEVYVVNLRQKKPYLGNLQQGETVNENGYFVRRGNRTVYPKNNRSLVVRLITNGGTEGWGETYGLVTPQATAAIVNDLLSGFVLGCNPVEREALHDQWYDLMRVRGYTGGFYLDALAAIDIALWDIAGKLAGQSIASLLGGRCRETIPAYVSGLPEDTLDARCQLAVSWQELGFDSFKFAMPVADEGPLQEMRMLRERLGAEARVACDLHWAYSASDAIALAKAMAPERPWFLEAPVAPEDVQALQQVAQHAGAEIAAGEEWRTIHDARPRIDCQAVHIVQPEMGHTGITQFMRICRYAEAHQLSIVPHATIGSGIFLAASLQASATITNVASHEFQHSVHEPFRHFTGDLLSCDQGAYHLPDLPGLGVQPSEEMRANMELVPA